MAGGIMNDEEFNRRVAHFERLDRIKASAAFFRSRFSPHALA
jgi:hypothetical protein